MARLWQSCRLLSWTQSSASFPLSLLSPSFFSLSLVLSSSLLRNNLCMLWLLGLWLSWTRQDTDLAPFLLGLWWMPKLPHWDTKYPSTKPSCMYRTNNIMITGYCHYTQIPQAWSESQKNLTDFTCSGHKKIKLRNASFILPSHLWQGEFPMASLSLHVTTLTSVCSTFHSLSN